MPSHSLLWSFDFIVRPRLFVLVTRINGVFSVGYPLLTYRDRLLYQGTMLNALGVNASGQVPIENRFETAY